MFKKIVAVLFVLAIIGIGVWKIFFSGDSLNDQVNNVLTNLTSYQLEANMEMNKGEEQRNFVVKVSYKKVEDKDYFRVSLYDTAINQEQIMLRNNEGVYVLTPALNQVYQFKSSWPLNSAKPYIYQSLLDVFNQEYQSQKLADGIIITSNPEFKNSPQYAKQEIKFSKDLVPLWVHLYDQNGNILVKVTFTKVETGVEFAEDYFSLTPNMVAARENVTGNMNVSFDDLPLLPTGADVSAVLKDQTSSNVNGVQVYILSYEGEDSFTVVQEIASNYTEMKIDVVNGEIIDLMGGFGVIDDTRLMYTYNGIQYTIYGDDLSVAKLVEIANGMEVVSTK